MTWEEGKQVAGNWNPHSCNIFFNNDLGVQFRANWSVEMRQSGLSGGCEHSLAYAGL
jgi:hypothetical protein